MIIAFHPIMLYTIRTATKIRVGCSGLMYRKALRLPKSSTEEGLNGRVITILSNDLFKLEFGLYFLPDAWMGPIEALTFGIVLYYEIGISAVLGIVFLISFIPLQGNVSTNLCILSSQYNIVSTEL